MFDDSVGKTEISVGNFGNGGAARAFALVFHFNRKVYGCWVSFFKPSYKAILFSVTQMLRVEMPLLPQSILHLPQTTLEVGLENSRKYRLGLDWREG